MKNRERDKTVQHFRNKGLVFECVESIRQVEERVGVLSGLLVHAGEGSATGAPCRPLRMLTQAAPQLP